MNDTEHWDRARDKKNGTGGRPSKIATVVKMDLSGFLNGTCGKPFGLNTGARALVSWVGERGEKISLSTAKRTIRRLKETGLIIGESAGKRGFIYRWMVSVAKETSGLKSFKVE